MKQRKKLLCLLLVLLLAVSLAPAAFAEFIFSGDEQNISGEYDSTVFLAGENPNSAADVKGILFEAGSVLRRRKQRGCVCRRQRGQLFRQLRP